MKPNKALNLGGFVSIFFHAHLASPDTALSEILRRFLSFNNKIFWKCKPSFPTDEKNIGTSHHGHKTEPTPLLHRSLGYSIFAYTTFPPDLKHFGEGLFLLVTPELFGKPPWPGKRSRRSATYSVQNGDCRWHDCSS